MLAAVFQSPDIWRLPSRLLAVSMATIVPRYA